ncbi:MAG: type II/IV secretion system ATPase subunit [Thermoplasmata archaeon]|jgi:flagellar protein FlaI|nr:type II/IV secretion system ATPase subunit [Thermoplasmata archaeon]
MPANLSAVMARNPHLSIYLQEYAQKTKLNPNFVETVTRDQAKDGTVNIVYPVGDPIFIHLHGSKDTGYRYTVVQPILTDDLRPKYTSVIDRVFLQAGKEKIHTTDQEFTEVVDKILKENVKVTGGRPPSKATQLFRPEHKIYMSDEDFSVVDYYVKRNVVQNGVLEPLLRDPYIEDIHCIGPKNINLYHKVFGMSETNIRFESLEDLDRYAKGMSERMGRPASISRPIIDGALPDGSRINIVYADDVSVSGPTFTIRKFATEPISAPQLAKWNTMSAQEAAYLWLCLENGMSVFVCGETASGKTTLLNAIFPFIRYDQKIFSAEDTLEVQPPQEVWQQLSTREFGPEDSRVDTFALLRAGLRSRPNYIIVGEIRGKEGNVAFQAMQTGIPVMATFHAASVKRMIQRFTGAPISVPITSMDNLNVAVFQAGIYRAGKLIRRTLSIEEILGYSESMGGVMTRAVFVWNPVSDQHLFRGMNNSFILEEKIAVKRGYKDKRDIYKELALRTRIIEKMMETNMTAYKTANDILKAFQKEGVSGLPFSV